MNEVRRILWNDANVSPNKTAPHQRRPRQITGVAPPHSLMAYKRYCFEDAKVLYEAANRDCKEFGKAVPHMQRGLFGRAKDAFHWLRETLGKRT